MDELIDALEAVAISKNYDIEDCDEDDLVQIEEQILLPLPTDFKTFLLTASHFVYGNIEPVTIGDPQLHTHLPEVTAEAWANGLERDLIPLCQIGMGYYCINEQGEVLLWQNGEILDEMWESIWNWVEEVWLGSL